MHLVSLPSLPSLLFFFLKQHKSHTNGLPLLWYSGLKQHAWITFLHVSHTQLAAVFISNLQAEHFTLSIASGLLSPSDFT
jgi:hypothetical protein